MIYNSKKKNKLEFFERLGFRRQFLIGPTSYKPNKFWKNLQINNNLFISIHEDLPCFVKERNGTTAILLGLAIDSLNPNLNEDEIIENFLKNSDGLTSFINKTTPLAGRWAFIYQKEDETYLFNDLTGLRQIFYYSDSKETWAASQPELIKTQVKLELNQDIEYLNFLLHPKLGHKESASGGIATMYKNCFHLSPNFYLDFNSAEQKRFYFGKKEATNNNGLEASKEVFKNSSKHYNRRGK